MANRLAEETSPYLLQHKDNPVDWRPWGPEALEQAKAEDKPIFLSIGYSACHWCHVMERESFEDPETAAMLNEHFVPIKVDREERPDVDDIYMEAVQGMTGQGGWPLSVFLDPEGVPFYGGTYFPPEPRHGLPSFRQVLEATVGGLPPEARRADGGVGPHPRGPLGRRTHRAVRRPAHTRAARSGRSPPCSPAPTPRTAASAALPSSRPRARSSSCSRAARPSTSR